MNNQRSIQSAILSLEVATEMSGGLAPHYIATLRAQDIYGDTMSIEDWMDYVAYDVPARADPHDFQGGKGK